MDAIKSESTENKCAVQREDSKTEDSNTEENKFQWTKRSFDDKLSWYFKPCNFIQIGENEILTLDQNGIFVYNICKDTWRSIEVKDERGEKIDALIDPKIAYDDQNKIIYVLQQFRLFAVKWISGKTELKLWKWIHFHEREGRANQRIICVNNKCHIVGLVEGDDFSLDGCQHQIWDVENNIMEMKHSFLQWQTGIYQYGIVHDKFDARILVFGGKFGEGYGSDGDDLNGDIMEFNIKNNIWKKLENHSHPLRYEFGTGVTKKGTLLIIGGSTGSPLPFTLEMNHEDIWIGSMKDMNFTKSPVVLPFKAQCSGIIVSHKQENDLKVSGWVREQQKQFQMRHIPVALVQLIGIFHGDEHLHVFIRHATAKWEFLHSWSHFSIGLDQILMQE